MFAAALVWTALGFQNDELVSMIIPEKRLATYGYTLDSGDRPLVLNLKNGTFFLRSRFSSPKSEGDLTPPSIMIQCTSLEEGRTWKISMQEDIDLLPNGGYHNGLPGGKIIGGDSQHVLTDSVYSTISKTPYSFTTVLFRAGGQRDERGFYKPAPFDDVHAKAVVESVLRNVTARAAGLAAEVLPSGKVEQAFTRMYRTRFTKVAHAKDWSLARGFSYEFDEDTQCLTMKKGKHEIFAPLGSKSIRVNGKWHEIPDIVSLKDGHILIPLDKLEEHRGG